MNNRPHWILASLQKKHAHTHSHRLQPHKRFFLFPSSSSSSFELLISSLSNSISSEPCFFPPCYTLLLCFPSIPLMSPSMNYTESKRKSTKQTQMLPPRRGQVKIRIFMSIMAALSCSGRDKKRRDEEDDDDARAPPLSSTSTTPPVPSGYTSGA